MRFAVYIKQPGRDVVVAASDDTAIAVGRGMLESKPRGSTVFMADHHAPASERYTLFADGKVKQLKISHETLHSALNY